MNHVLKELKDPNLEFSDRVCGLASRFKQNEVERFSRELSDVFGWENFDFVRKSKTIAELEEEYTARFKGALEMLVWGDILSDDEYSEACEDFIYRIEKARKYWIRKIFEKECI